MPNFNGVNEQKCSRIFATEKLTEKVHFKMTIIIIISQKIIKEIIIKKQNKL